MLDKIQAEHRDHITLKQSPVLVAVALSIFIGGLGMVAVAAYGLSTMLQPLAGSVADGLGLVGNLMYLFAYGGQFWGIGIIGLGMIVGSLRGMQDIWTSLFNKLGLFQNA